MSSANQNPQIFRRLIVAAVGAIAVFELYKYYRARKNQQRIDKIAKLVERQDGTEKIQPLQQSNNEFSGCGMGDSCCQTQKENVNQPNDCGQGDVGCCNNNNDDDDDFVYSDISEEELADDHISIAGSHDGPLLDIEDLGQRVNENEMNKDQNSSSDSGANIEDNPLLLRNPKRKGGKKSGKFNDFNDEKTSIPKNSVAHLFRNHQEMIETELRETLTKQGYKLVGSHSGVKLCRWTKSMLRNQGGCYKHTFYGIASHQCMESTPNLACANKCVFCWRHQKNPTGTEWKWKMDKAETVIEGLIEQHYKMIKQFRGVPGVTPQTMAEGMRLRHAALSLVGEPIMYPEINRFISLLHQNGVSSFLVTNGTFPDQIRDVTTCTQLYLSVDAPTEKSHKKVDRPLFKDAWRRFINSCENLSKRKERTIFRLTVVKGWNDDEIDNYAQLAMIGKPDMIEVKGVTYCGTAWAGNTEDNSVLALKNVPFHEEIVDLCQILCDSINDYIARSSAAADPVKDPETASWVDKYEYVIASEHAHSNCVMMANKKKFYKEETKKWYTHIDFDKFIELEASGKEFSALDYSIETPEWAVFGHESQGFNPEMTRVYRKGANKKKQKMQVSI